MILAEDGIPVCVFRGRLWQIAEIRPYRFILTDRQFQHVAR